MKKRARGRPSQGRTEFLEVKLTPEEKERFQKAANVHGLSLSDWVRLNLRACSAPDQNAKLPGFNPFGTTEGSR